jgi:malto-oligosyltrehalose synthase/4-alpha-glucanotransferase
MYNPISTYRIQFHNGFDFNAFEKIIPYLVKLGIKTIYASPIFAAVPGSMHGYDCIDPHRINPEIGTLEQLYNITKKLKSAGIGWLQDISPNHMAYHPGNKWLMDVLENGSVSVYAKYFDIDWTHPVLHGKLQAPFLETSLELAVEQGDLMLVMENSKLWLKYDHRVFPLNTSSVRQLFGDENLQTNDDAQLSKYLERVNNEERDVLLKVAGEQHYLLCHKADTDKTINYRRFFIINELICMNMQDEAVFQDYHTLVKKLVDDDVIQGLRIDHIDGLADPTGYLFRLRQLLGDDIYLVAEKILERGEPMSNHWPLDGNTGYDFMALANNLLTSKKNEVRFTSFYEDELGQKEPFRKQLLRKKALILCYYMSGELDNLFTFFKTLHLVKEDEIDNLGEEPIKNAIASFLVWNSVYRYYSNRFPLEPADADAVKSILERIECKDEKASEAIVLLRSVLLERPNEGDQEYNARAARFFMRCMQFSGPLMAKGVEDTLMYTYNRFIGHNEVGDSPDEFGISLREFSAAMCLRQLKWPYTLNATATHDTKRGEDVRARLNVLSDVAPQWLETVREWQKINARLKENGFPDDNDEYAIYQTLIGSCFSCDGLTEGLRDRLLAYYQKAFREAKTHTDWNHPDEVYEQSVRHFLDKLFDHQPFISSFNAFQEKITDMGIVNSLTQVLLKCSCPGVPDFYQGCEMWSFSLVDPDNRRPVDYSISSNALDHICDSPGGTLVHELWNERRNGRIKLWLTHTLLTLRNDHPEVFSRGHHIPLKVRGIHKKNIIAYLRMWGRIGYIFVAPLHIGQLCKKQNCGVSDIDWGNTYVRLPAEIPVNFENLLYSATAKHSKKIHVKEVFHEMPFAILKFEMPLNDRGSGVLLPVFSLNSPFGIGDFGKGARAFADYLQSAGQKYWQLLPLNQTDNQTGYSPYSSVSAMAGNSLLISPEMLVYDGLLKANDLEQWRLPNIGKVNYEQVEKGKYECLMATYKTFKSGSFPLLEYKFQHFCNKHAYWLDDFALFVVLKRQFNSEPWHKWPAEYKQYNLQVLADYAGNNQDRLEEIKWAQFIAEKQWKLLRDYCNDLGIAMVGDIPFYSSYDSVDVWAHPEYFTLDVNGNMAGIGGVPPDYFSATGQLWNVPTYNWAAMKEGGYDWWTARLKRQLELFDLIRIDHFRALADYWQVPAGESTAQNGRWMEGPGAEFFDVLSKQLGKLPFIAEDLGNDMEKAYLLRDKIGLPGMKVLQFAWGDNMPSSVDAPHNYSPYCFVYTGTHDNNTTVGWYNELPRKKDRKRLRAYLGYRVKSSNIHIAMSRLAYASVAQVAILPMQDILGLDEPARINYPGSDKGNWLWRMPENSLSTETAERLRRWVLLYNRL